eukprot:8512289-Pyramimonas_sp.AAC.1
MQDPLRYSIPADDLSSSLIDEVQGVEVNENERMKNPLTNEDIDRALEGAFFSKDMILYMSLYALVSPCTVTRLSRNNPVLDQCFNCPAILIALVPTCT